MFEKNLKLALEVTGALTSAVGFGLLFFDEKYVAAFVLALVSLGLLLHAASRTLRGPITYKSCRWYVRIMDKDARKTNFRKEKVLVANERNITTLADRNFSSSGKLEFIKSNIGQMLPPVEEGGTKTVYTVLKTPLPRGKEIRHIIEIVAWDSFPEKRKSFSALTSERWREIAITIEFPSERPPRLPKAYFIYKGEATELDTLTLSRDGLQLELAAPRPKVGSKYLIDWEW